MSEPDQLPGDIVCLDDEDSDEEEDDDIIDIPDVATCQKLVEEFAAITSTDEACAQFYLQDRKWNLEHSVNAFFEASSGGVKVLTDGEEPELVVTFDSKMVSSLKAGKVTQEAPKTFRFITWNIDGLDNLNLKKRTKAVAKVIESEKADIVLLQEVVPSTLSYLQDLLPQFVFIVGDTMEYFTATLLRRTTTHYDDHTIIPFDNTTMGRNLLSVQAHIGDLKLHLMNTHLESTAEFSKQRREQLKIGFNRITSTPSGVSGIFAGDLNLRDKELAAEGLPAGIFDMWEACGRRQECKFTWDTARNTNKQFPGSFKPRLRFDRVYLRPSNPPTLNAEHFGLVGIQRVTGTQSFPSDHWGIIIHFKVRGTSSESSDASSSTSVPSTST
ncbi:hypothetical protein Pmani_037668 [Petrolisthes manimaculis]|uniref:Tyrosyl-DNA phosphodiesterase 2 n=1 Tax=Petrolisthes manimaculis TaxID=1843537 RepID=A0AAE1TN24_9EUCA|nr:hypothetical protein Pmani_037668 [Petrolisthes manimaculis]